MTFTGSPMVLTNGPVIRRHTRRRKEPIQARRRNYLVSASNRHPPLDNCPDEQPTGSARLSIMFEPAPVATIGELLRDLATAILIAVSGRTRARRNDNRRNAPPDASA
jgi:hypothetical protein